MDEENKKQLREIIKDIMVGAAAGTISGVITSVGADAPSLRKYYHKSIRKSI
jgi:hypothetical protein